jgi:hypothetical protein
VGFDLETILQLVLFVVAMLGMYVSLLDDSL